MPADAAQAEEILPPGEKIVPQSGLFLERAGSSEERGSSRFSSFFSGADPIEAMVVRGVIDQLRPEAGHQLQGFEEWQWTQAEFDDKGEAQGRLACARPGRSPFSSRSGAIPIA